MLRVTDLKLPFDHDDGALKAELLERLGIPESDLISFEVFRRSTDARKRSAIFFVYIIDAEVRDESVCLGQKRVSPAPDMDYPFVAPPISERNKPSMVDISPPVMRLIILAISAGPLKVALSFEAILNWLKL